MSESNTNPLILLPLRMICLGLMDLLTFTDFRHTDIPSGSLHRLLKARTTLPQSHDARKVPLPATMGSLSYAFPAPGIRRTGLFECPVA